MSPGLGVTGSLGGIREMHGEYILAETWEYVPSPFTTRRGIHRSLRHPGSVWPLQFSATENNNQYRVNMCLRGKRESGGDGGGVEEDEW